MTSTARPSPRLGSRTGTGANCEARSRAAAGPSPNSLDQEGRRVSALAPTPVRTFRRAAARLTAAATRTAPAAPAPHFHLCDLEAGLFPLNGGLHRQRSHACSHHLLLLLQSLIGPRNGSQ